MRVFPALKPPTRIFTLTYAAIRANPAVAIAYVVVLLAGYQIDRSAPQGATYLTAVFAFLSAVAASAVVICASISWYFGQDITLTPERLLAQPVRDVFVWYLLMSVLAFCACFLLSSGVSVVLMMSTDAGRALMSSAEASAGVVDNLAMSDFLEEMRLHLFLGAEALGLPVWIYLNLFMGLRLPALVLRDPASRERTRIPRKLGLVSAVVLAYLLGAFLPDLVIIALTAVSATPSTAYVAGGAIVSPANGFDVSLLASDVVCSCLSLVSVFALALVLAEANAHHLRRSVPEEADVFA